MLAIMIDFIHQQKQDMSGFYHCLSRLDVICWYFCTKINNRMEIIGSNGLWRSAFGSVSALSCSNTSVFSYTHTSMGPNINSLISCSCYYTPSLIQQSLSFSFFSHMDGLSHSKIQWISTYMCLWHACWEW